MAVGREVRWYPIEDDGNIVLVQVVDEVHEIVRRTVSRRGSTIARSLISPGTVERMLHDWEQLDVSESQPIHMVGQSGRDLAIGERTVVFLGDAHPGAEMNLIDRYRRVQ